MSYRVLVMLKPTEVQPALERAADFARFMPDLQVVVVSVINHFTEENKTKLQDQRMNEIERMMAHYQSIKQYEIRVICDTEVSKAFCQLAKDPSWNFDLAIISANKRNTLKDLFVQPIDSQIMRHIHIPILVIKDVRAPHRLGRAIVVATDFDETNHDEHLDEMLYVAAKAFADNFNGLVHVLNCVTPLNRGIMGGNTKSSFVLGTDYDMERHADHSARLHKFAEKFDIDKTRCHLAEGRVDEMIPKVARTLDARMICMGMSNRNGVLSAIDESSSELVLEQVPCDILLVNHHVKYEQMILVH